MPVKPKQTYVKQNNDHSINQEKSKKRSNLDETRISNNQY